MDGGMPLKTFANQKALIEYAKQNGLVYLWAGPERRPSPIPTFTKRSRCSRQINTRLWMYAHPVVA